LDERELFEKMRDSLAELDMEMTKETCKKALEAGVDPYLCITEGLSPGLELVGSKYERAEYFLMELIMAGEIMKETMKILEPYLKTSTEKRQPIGKIVIGAVLGDLHDIGKNIVITLLQATNFEVYDLGSDVSADKFVEAVRNLNPDILGLSALLTTTLDEMENIINELKKADLRESVKVIIGGGAVYESFAKRIGADGWSTSAVTGVEQCKRWVIKN
jgi:5-methyltetrahydrofolate--homocysteine methyltransferase